MTVAAPVETVQSRRAFEEYGSRNGRVLELGQNDENPIRVFSAD